MEHNATHELEQNSTMIVCPGLKAYPHHIIVNWHFSPLHIAEDAERPPPQLHTQMWARRQVWSDTEDHLYRGAHVPSIQQGEQRCCHQGNTDIDLLHIQENYHRLRE